MPLENILSEEEQHNNLELAETFYSTSTNWNIFKSKFEEYSVLHHPYMGIATAAGQIFLHNATRPEALSPIQLMNLKEQSSVLKAKGGSISFDIEYELGELSSITKYLPKGVRGKIQNSLWEDRIIETVQKTLPLLDRAIQLDDTEENENKVGYTKEGLLDLSAFTQSYLIIKTQGSFSNPHQISALKEGQIILNYK
jgi:hypothetical protein